MGWDDCGPHRPCRSPTGAKEQVEGNRGRSQRCKYIRRPLAVESALTWAGMSSDPSSSCR